jgi:hypothetical protein
MESAAISQRFASNVTNAKLASRCEIGSDGGSRAGI